MRKSVKILIFAIILSLSLGPVKLIKSEAPSSAIFYLKSQTPDAWVTMALSAAGETNLETGYLKEVNGTQATDYEKAILAIAAAKANPHTFGNIDYVVKLKSFYNNNQLGQTNLLNDDIWGILALSAAGEKNDSLEISSAKTFVLANQNQDGGWGYGIGTMSDTNDTASAIMALLEAGLSSTSSEIIKATAYLKSAQNDDGGFPYDPKSEWGKESDSSSDAWVISAIYKLGQDPTLWIKNNNNPVDQLKTLQDPSGAFKWVASDPTSYTAMTAYAVIALAGKSYPVAKFSQGSFNLRIEGKSTTLCQTEAEALTALDIIKEAASLCNYSYEIKDTSFGPYLNKINNEEAQGMSGWLYLVNNSSPTIGANDYYLKEGDEVTWYYGDWGWQPIRLTSDEGQINSGQAIELSAEYFDGTTWLPLEGAEIKYNGSFILTSASGKADLSLADGSYNLIAEKTGFIRSNQIKILVGGKKENLSLEVEVENGKVLGDQTGNNQEQSQDLIAFEVDKSSLDFGKLQPGQISSSQIKISNQGIKISVESQVSGNSLFVNNFKLDNKKWSEFKESFDPSQEKDINASLKIPADYLGVGVKTGQLILWAIADED